MITTKNFQLAVRTFGNQAAEQLALILPGRLDTKDYSHMLAHAEYLAQRNYLSVTFDPPGTWESTGDISLYTMTNYLQAINELIEHYGNRPTLLMGHSRGGSMAVLAGMRHQCVTKFISVMGACSYAPDKYETDSDGEWQRLGYKINRRELPGKDSEFVDYQLPYSFADDAKQYDLYDELRVCQKPKLFIYGTRDQLVPPPLAEEIFAVASEPKELVMIDSDHDYRRSQKMINEVNDLVGQFLERYP